MTQIILGGNGVSQVGFELKMANRHGLIAGATGTGKPIRTTVSEIGPLANFFGEYSLVY